ncbi:MAG: four helix bundle protein [Desulfobulbaceae bacterium]|nr:four helix bundle protein [Desulfobulbaceae bacterium]
MARFGFEDLDVWQRAVSFAEMVIVSSDKWQTKGKHYRLLEQLESAVTSVAMNIAEGKGRFSKKEFVQYLYIARGSLFEVVTLLVIVERLKWITGSDLATMKEEAEIIGKMLSSLANSLKATIK